jgi:hypothetical protein
VPRVSLCKIWEAAGMREALAQRWQNYEYEIWSENNSLSFRNNDNEGRSEGAD